MSNPARDAAFSYLARGWCPVPIPPKSKGPKHPSWQTLRLTEADLPGHFPDPSNVGINLGEPSGGLTDIDLDCTEALELADQCLPQTASFGRASKPRSHRLYIASGSVTEKFQDPIDRSTLLEIRATPKSNVGKGIGGSQTVFPGSVHPSGEPVAWTDGAPADPLVMPAPELRAKVVRFACACLLKRRAPELLESFLDAPDTVPAGVPENIRAQLAQWLGAPAPATPKSAPVVRAPRAFEAFRDAREAFNSDHRFDPPPRSGGPCPATGCAGKNSFKLIGDSGRATCFHASHPEGCGTASAGCHVIDPLDVAAHNSGCSTRELLERDGYLATRTAPPAPATAPARRPEPPPLGELAAPPAPPPSRARVPGADDGDDLEPELPAEPTVLAHPPVHVPAEDDPWAQYHVAMQAMNEDHFVLQDGSKVVIAAIGYDHELQRERLDRMTTADFRLKYQPMKVSIPAGEGKVKEAPVAALWLDYKSRRQYDGVVLDPTGRAPLTVYNLWKGFAVKHPVAGDWSLLRNHVHDVICGGDETLFAYVLRWMAAAVQRPDQPGQVALVMRGREGCGKGILARTLMSLFGVHGLHITRAGDLVGRFNPHLATTVLLFADEAFFAGDRQHVSQLKGLITEPTIAVEAKFQDLRTVRNRLHIVMASNEQWVIPASLDSRRFVVVDVPDARKGDQAYFSELHSAAERPAFLSAMLHELLSLDLAGFDVFAIPQTAALSDQRSQTLSGAKAWLYEVLQIGEYITMEGVHTEIGSTEANREGWHKTRDLYLSYKTWARSRPFERPEPVRAFGRVLCLAALPRPAERTNERGWSFGALHEAQNRFGVKTTLTCDAETYDGEED